jgi:hypothetical protein
MNRIFILSYKPTSKDSRVLNQYESLKYDYETKIIELKNLKTYKKKKKFREINEEKNYSLELFFSKLEKIKKNFFYLQIYKNKDWFLWFYKKIISLNKKFLRTPKYFSYLKNIFLINNILIKKINKILKKPNIIICNDLFTLPAGIFFKIKYKSKIVYDMHEYELDRVPKKKFITVALLYLFEEITLPFADYIITVSYSIKQYYKKRFNRKIFLILNAPSTQKFVTSNTPFAATNKLKNFIIIGNISYGRNVNELIEIFKKTQLDLTFMGDINDKFNEEQKFLHKINDCKNIHYKPAVKPGIVADILKEFDASLFFYDLSYKNYDYALPNKFLLSIIMQKPIVCFESTELKLFQDRHNIQLNLINNLNEIKNLNIKLNKTKLNTSEMKFYSLQRQSKTLKKIVKNLSIKANN